jgi:hypothetical protein
MKKIFIIVGWLHIPRNVIQNVFLKYYGFNVYQCWFLDKDSYLKSQFSYANATNKKIEAIFVGPIPHKSFAAKGNSSMVTEVSISGSITPVYVCKNKSGILKFTKTSVKQAIAYHEAYRQELIQKQAYEEKQIKEFMSFIQEIFPHQKIF